MNIDWEQINLKRLLVGIFFIIISWLPMVYIIYIEKNNALILTAVGFIGVGMFIGGSFVTSSRMPFNISLGFDFKKKPARPKPKKDGLIYLNEDKYYENPTQGDYLTLDQMNELAEKNQKQKTQQLNINKV